MVDTITFSICRECNCLVAEISVMLNLVREK